MIIRRDLLSRNVKNSKKWLLTFERYSFISKAHVLSGIIKSMHILLTAIIFILPEVAKQLQLNVHQKSVVLCQETDELKIA